MASVEPRDSPQRGSAQHRGAGRGGRQCTPRQRLGPSLRCLLCLLRARPTACGLTSAAPGLTTLGGADVAFAGKLKSSSAITRETIVDIADNASGSEPEEQLANCDAESCSKRRMSVGYHFFDTPPYTNVGAVGGQGYTWDSHGDFCEAGYNDPPISNPQQAGFPQDATNKLVKADMACGIAPMRFVFTTSTKDRYLAMEETASMQVVITCTVASFIESETCESILAATDKFPRVSTCFFVGNQAFLTLATRLEPGHRYSVTIKVMMPSTRKLASENSFELAIKYQGKDTIEGTESPIDMVAVVPSAKDLIEYGDDFEERGYITAFLWQPTVAYQSYAGLETKFTFALRTFGVLKNKLGYVIEIVAYPTNVWRFGTPGSECDGYEASGFVGTTCEYRSFPGATATESNGFQLKVGTTSLINLGVAEPASFSIKLTNPTVAVNAFWMATSFRYDDNQIPHEIYSVFLDKPVSVLGPPTGSIVGWELASVSQEQWVTLELYPGNTLMPAKTEQTGILVIIPPPSFSVITNQEPEYVDGYNPLPCTGWPEADRVEGRWICLLKDEVPFADTPYRVRFRVQNPLSPGAALSWRVELWQAGSTKPIAVTRQIVGMPISGTMSAALAPTNQLLGAENIIKFDFTPSQDIGDYVDTRLEVEAPPGFVIKKTPSNVAFFDIPDCKVKGSDSNTFTLTFNESNALRAGRQYIFALEVTNPTAVVPEELNFWNFNTVRPDGVGRDTARYQGFDMYPTEFKSFKVMPASRYAGSQYLTVSFISSEEVKPGEYIRVRAPVGVNWDTDDLDFDSTSTATGSNDLLIIGSPIVGFTNGNELEMQVRATLLVNLEYGFRCKVIVPVTTPVPNRWWIEQYEAMGDLSQSTWSNVAAKGAEGFLTQALINVVIQPFNVVKEGWDNPTLIVFEMATEVPALQLQSVAGTETIPAELYIQAPPRFTYICPLETTLYMPAGAQAIPSDVSCNVVTQTTGEARILHLLFPTGLKAGIQYAFTIDVVNAPFIEPTDNSFVLETRTDGTMVETVTVYGYQLADQMDNTRYYPYSGPCLQTRLVCEDRKALATSNVVTFILGLASEIVQDTILQVKAPVGYSIQYDCTRDVGDARDWVPNMFELPRIDTCQNLELTDPTLVYVADIYFQSGDTWGRGSHAMWIRVANPQFDSARNFWGFTIRNVEELPLVSEPWVYGFHIQAVTPVSFRPYVPANSINGEAAINPVDFDFVLTTSLPASTDKSGVILIQAPDGFFFPRVCQDFTPNTRMADKMPLPESTQCSGDSDRLLTLKLPPWYSLQNGTTYQIRFTVINPGIIFSFTDNARLWWRIETKYEGAQVDLNSVVPSFPVYQRLQYFSVDTLSQIGDETTNIRVLFRLDSELRPQKTITITGPDGMVFRGVGPYGFCVDPDLDIAIIGDDFPKPAISGVISMPEWMECRVDGDTVMLRNTESVLAGRSLENVMIFEFFIQNVSNPKFVPDVNLFLIVAETDNAYGQELWYAEAWDLFPQLSGCSVASSNIGYGLYTNFTFTLRTVTEVPTSGSIQIVGPDDYYFGPILGYENDPLQSAPPPQGLVDERPPPNQINSCSLLRPVEAEWVCVLEFQPCLEKRALEEQGTYITQAQQDDLAVFRAACLQWETICDDGDLSQLFQCEGQSSMLTLTLRQDVILPAGRFFQIKIPGMNTRYAPTSPAESLWLFRTRGNDVDKTILDERVGVPGVTLLGPVSVMSIVPANTKVSSLENRVTVTVRLAVTCEPYALMRVRHPLAYLKSENAAITGLSVAVADSWPTKTIDIVVLDNLVEFTSFEEAFPADTDLTFTIILSNPPISPLVVDNIWSFEVFSRANSDTYYMLNIHRHVAGFKVFGEFSVADIVPSILSPTAENRIFMTFMLKSPLAESDRASNLLVWLPFGWVPNDYVPPGSTSKEDRWWIEWFPDPDDEPPEQLPGTTAAKGTDPETGQHYVRFSLGTLADSGIEYRLAFDVFNPAVTPTDTPNEWRLQTSLNGVLLHLQSGIGGFRLQELVRASVTPADTTSNLAHNKVAFFMESNLRIRGGSIINITAPAGFQFDCYDPLALFETRGLATTTTCFVPSGALNRATLRMDGLDEKLPNSPFTVIISAKNPEFTPEKNWFKFEIFDDSGKNFVDVANVVPAYDITGPILVDLKGVFPYFGYTNPLILIFFQTTILNMAEEGNELVLTGPKGYVFPPNCTGFSLRYTLETARTEVPGSGNTFQFPPSGIQCIGFGNSTVIIQLPVGSGLLIKNYTMTIDVEDPLFGEINSTDNVWSFVTRVSNNVTGQRIIDSNISVVQQWDLNVLAAESTDEGGASPHAMLAVGAFLASALAFALP